MCGGSCRDSKTVHILNKETPIAEMPPIVSGVPDATKVPSDQQQQQSQHPSDQQSGGGTDRIDASDGSSQYYRQQTSPPPFKGASSLDLTEENALQKAIALSIQEQQQQQHFNSFSKPGGDSGGEFNNDGEIMIVSNEDREVSRALEESLREVPSTVVKKKTNPLERKRDKDVPVGLVNIGNSCWFNVVSQPLFHLPGFREMILNYRPRAPTNTSMPTSKEKTDSVKISVALSKLFALMLASEQKYVAPTECVSLFQGGDNERRRNEQEDVCEFIHKLLERLELEFNEVMREEGEEKESSGISKDMQFSNPIMKFFYGQKYSKGGITSPENLDGKGETFGQYPLHVLKYGDIHDSILASMSGLQPDRNFNDKNTDINTPHTSSGPSVDELLKSEDVQQEFWFKLLPPVLIFSLSRYEFSRDRQRAEKVHNKFEFPELLYMDRYMESNKEVVLRKHVQVSAIKKQLAKLNHTLKQYQQFGSGNNKYPLKDILAYALQFAETGVECEEKACTLNEYESFSSVSNPKIEEHEELPSYESPVIIDECLTSPSCMCTETEETKVEITEVMEVDSADESKEPTHKDSLTVKYGPPRADIDNRELKVLQNCLSRWETRIRNVENELCSHISQLENQLKEMYSEPELLKTAYRLHAVVVHEGQASAGHYWVYIRNGDTWCKYNDVQISKSSWEELQQDSLGGQNNASAYCLMYTDSYRHGLLYSSSHNANDSLEEHLQSLPVHLQEFVKQHNLNFQEEIMRWENRSSQSTTQNPSSPISQSPHTSRCHTEPAMPPPTAPNSPDVVCVPQQDEFDVSFYININTITCRHIQTHLKRLLADKSLEVDIGNEVMVCQRNNKLGDQCLEIFKDLVKKLNSTADDCSSTLQYLPSMLDFGLFLYISGAPSAKSILLVHLSVLVKTVTLMDVQNVDGILHQCNVIFKESCTPTVSKLYHIWQNKYKLLLDSIWHFNCGFKAFQIGDYKQALPILIKTYHIHKEFLNVRSSELQSYFTNSTLHPINEDLLINIRCKCLVALNNSLIENFLNSSMRKSAEDVVLCVSGLLVPALCEFTTNTRESDVGASVRNQWCELLEKQLPAHCGELIGQVLEAVLADCPANKTSSLPVSMGPMPVVNTLFSEYRSMLPKSTPPNATAL